MAGIFLEVHQLPAYCPVFPGNCPVSVFFGDWAFLFLRNPSSWKSTEADNEK